MEDNQQEINKMDLESILGLYGASSKQPTNPDCGKIYLIGIDEENKGDSDDSCSTDC